MGAIVASMPQRTTTERLTDEKIDRLADLVRLGHYLESAAALVGVGRTSFYRWLAEGARLRESPPARPSSPERRLMAFHERIEAAAAQSEHSGLAAIAMAGTQRQTSHVTTTTASPDGTTVVTRTEDRPPDWRATAWRMERRFGRRWALQAAVELSGPEGGPVPVTVSASDVLGKLAELREARAAEPITTAGDSPEDDEGTDDLQPEQRSGQ